MPYGKKIKFTKKGQIKEAWDEFVKPYIKVEKGIRTLQDKNHVPTDFMFAVYCKCDVSTLWNYENKSGEPYEKFHKEMKEIKTDYIAIMGESSLLGNNNANFWLSRKLGFIEINKIKMEEDKESIALLEKFNRMDNAEFKEEMKKHIK
jgi:hypothetical protein